jgi:hypothetical protein
MAGFDAWNTAVVAYFTAGAAKGSPIFLSLDLEAIEQHIFCMISVNVAPLLRSSIATTWAVLLPSRGAAASRGLAAFLPWGGFWAVVAFGPVLALAHPWRPVRHSWPWVPLFGFAGGSAFDSALWPRPQTRVQIWPAAAL